MSSPIPPNDTDPPKIRLRKAKEWLIQNPTETQAVASRIFNIHKKTLNNSINRGQSNAHHGGQNKILSQSQEHAIHTFIQSYLNHGQTPTRYILFGIICQLQSRQGKNPPSERWFSSWWKEKGLHKIKTKPIARERITVQDEKEVDYWFEGYKAIIAKYGIKRGDVHNFDETGFRVGCPKGVEVIVPLDVKEV
jgi:hypothetical protein